MALAPRVCVGAIVVAVFLAATIPPASGFQPGAPDEEASVSASISITRHTPEAVAFEVQFEITGNVSDLMLYQEQPDGSFESNRGFETNQRGAYWTGDPNPTLTYLYSLNRSANPDCRCIVTRRWATFYPPDVSVRWITPSGSERMELFAPDRPIGTENVSAYTNPGFIFVGEYTTEHRSIGTGRSLTVVVPGAVYQPGLALDQRLADLEHAGALLDNGSTADRNSVLFVLPTVREDADDVIRREWLRSMGASKTHFTYIRESARPGGWVHEFTHVALEFDTTPRMRWLREASATYTGQYVTLQRGYWPRSEFRDRLNAHRGADGVLGNQSTWTRLTPYRKGAVVLAYLDQRIREETDGDRTIFAVFRRLNGEEVVTYSEFKQAVASVVGDHRLDAEIDRYVLTGANPANHEYLYVVGEDPGIP